MRQLDLNPPLKLFPSMAAINIGSLKLPSLPAGWTAEKEFKPLGKLSQATRRNIEPVGAHFLAEARRVSVSGLLISPRGDSH